jgi:hypothetical protein
MTQTQVTPEGEIAERSYYEFLDSLPPLTADALKSLDADGMVRHVYVHAFVLGVLHGVERCEHEFKKATALPTSGETAVDGTHEKSG